MLPKANESEAESDVLERSSCLLIACCVFLGKVVEQYSACSLLLLLSGRWEMLV